MNMPQRPAPEYGFAGTRVRMLLTGRQTDGAFCMMEMSGPPGTSTPTHVHTREDETVHVVEGELDVFLGDDVVTLRAGDTALLKRHEPHRIVIGGPGTARYLVVCTPAGFDDFVLACSGSRTGPIVPTPPTRQEVARLVEAAPRFGISLLPG